MPSDKRAADEETGRKKLKPNTKMSYWEVSVGRCINAAGTISDLGPSRTTIKGLPPSSGGEGALGGEPLLVSVNEAASEKWKQIVAQGAKGNLVDRALGCVV